MDPSRYMAVAWSVEAGRIHRVVTWSVEAGRIHKLYKLNNYCISWITSGLLYWMIGNNK